MELASRKVVTVGDTGAEHDETVGEVVGRLVAGVDVGVVVVVYFCEDLDHAVDLLGLPCEPEAGEEEPEGGDEGLVPEVEELAVLLVDFLESGRDVGLPGSSPCARRRTC